MRKFSSYGPIDTDLHYYAPRKSLMEQAAKQLTGDNPEKGGHYITVWAPRQTGKSWLMLQLVRKLQKKGEFEAAIMSMQSGKNVKSDESLLELFVDRLRSLFKKDFPYIDEWKKIYSLFTKDFFQKPVILVMDEFDALSEKRINSFANEFREMYISRIGDEHKSPQKECLLHGLALVGVRSVLGIENVTGSPFNVQRSLHIPSLTFNEVEEMFQRHERETGQIVDPEVIERLFYETKGQPGLTCWFGELLTEGWNEFRVTPDMPVNMELFDRAYLFAACLLPNNNILNIISKAKKEPYRRTVLRLFGTKAKTPFAYDKTELNFLYMNGVIDVEEADGKLYVKFPCPFVQKRLFNYFTDEIFDLGEDDLYDPFEEIESAITEKHLDIRNIINLYQKYILKNKDWMFKEAPKRSDMRIFEAVFHFNLYMYLSRFAENFKGVVYPEFPTGNGRIDLMVKYAGKLYGIEVKTYTDIPSYKKALEKAAQYGRQLGLEKISLIFFIETIDDGNRAKLEEDFEDPKTGVKVEPIFVATENGL